MASLAAPAPDTAKGAGAVAAALGAVGGTQDDRAEIILASIDLSHTHTRVRVQRRHLTQEHLREVYHVNIIALAAGPPMLAKRIFEDDKERELLYPEEWKSKCAPDPQVYTCVHQDDADVLDNDYYVGESAVVARAVPSVIPAHALQMFINRGLEDEQLELAELKVKLRAMTDKLRKVEKLITDLPNWKGEAENAQQMLQERKRRARQLEILRQGFSKEVDRLEDELTKLQGSTGEQLASSYTLEQAAEDTFIRCKTWVVQFVDTEIGNKLAFMACHKRTWHEIWLAEHKDDKKWAVGKHEQDLIPPGYKRVRTNGIRFLRERHGKGMLRFLDERGFASGTWKCNSVHGQATVLTAAGRFQGNLSDGLKRGTGTMIYSRGDTFSGELGVRTTRPAPSLFNGLEYADGLPCGRGRITFVDRSEYDGYFLDGSPCGRGSYTDLLQRRMEGNFADIGLLHGEGSMANEEITVIGTFRRGLAIGTGTEMDARLGSHLGDFSYSLKHGFGKTELMGVHGELASPHLLGMRNGTGALDYGTVARADEGDAASSKTTDDAKTYTRYRYFGRWRADQVRGEGVFTDKGTTGGDPLTYVFAHSNDIKNAGMPGLEEWLQRQIKITKEREIRNRATLKALVDQRRAQERKNFMKYKAWDEAARKALIAIAARTREERSSLLEFRREMRKRQELNAENVDLDELEGAIGAAALAGVDVEDGVAAAGGASPLEPVGGAPKK